MSNLVPENVIINGHRIAHGEHGAGEAVVLIHGTPSYSHIWRNVAPKLVDTGHKVYLFDLLGFGNSERPRDPQVDTSVSAQVPILLALMDHWGLNHVHIVGHDIGGAIAMRFSVFHKERVKSLTVIDTVSFDSWPSQRTREQMKSGLDTLINAPDADHRRHFSNWLLSAVHNSEGLREGALSKYIGMISGPVGQGSLFQHQIGHYDNRHTSELDDRLSELGRIPVQIVWGENDVWQVTDWAHRLQNAIPGSKLHILSECGHFAMEDKPKEISDLVRTFLTEHSE